MFACIEPLDLHLMHCRLHETIEIYLCGGMHEYLLQRIVTMLLESDVILKFLAVY
jgi:hypothetical protein